MSKKNNTGIWIAIIVGISLLGVAFIVTNYLKDKDNKEFLYEQTQQQVETEAQLSEEEQEMDNKIAYAECLQESYDSYIDDWNSNCKNFSLGEDKSGGEAECLLPERIADTLDENKDKIDEQCEKLFLEKN